MSCIPNNREELQNRVQNKKAVFNTSASQTQQDTIGHLEYLQDNFVKRDGKYTVKGTDVQLGDTVTTRIGKWWERRNPLPQSPEMKKIVNQKAEVGNLVHDVNELIGNAILEYVGDVNPVDFMKVVIPFESLNYSEGLKKIKEEYGYDIAPTELLNIFAGVYEVIKQAYARQKAINTRTGNSEGKPYIVFEQILIDPKDNLGGTADMVVVYSDNTATILDFKTKIPRKDTVDSAGNLIKEIITTSDRERYKMQLGSLSKILKQNLGVSKVVSAPIHFITVRLPWDKTTKSYTKKITKISHGQKQDKFLQQLRPLTESTGFDDLDKFLQSIDKRLRDFNNKIKTDKSKRDQYKDRIAELEQSKRDILTNHNFNTILKYAQKVDDELTDDRIDGMTINELREYIDELKTLTVLADSTFEYRTQMVKSGRKSQEQMDMFVAEIGVLHAALNDKIAILEEQLFNKKIVTLVESVTGDKITDEYGKILPFNDEGFFNRYFNQLSQFENPLFKTLRNKISSAQYETRSSVNKVIEDVQSNEDALYNWMKANGKDKQWFVETFIDTTTDNLVNKLSDDFQKQLKQLRVDKDVTKIKEFYDLRDPKVFDSPFYKELKIDEKWIKALYDGKLVLKPSVEKKNLNTKYAYIQSVPELANYYNMLTKWNKEFRTILGVDYFQLPNNFIPNIRKTVGERITDLGLVGGMKQSIDNLIKELDVREDDMFYGELEDGRLTRRIPRFFINQFKNEDESLNIGEKSYELGKSLVLFAKMAYNFKEMTAIESEVVGLREFLIERGQEFIVKKGKHLEDYVGNKLTTAIGGGDTQKIFDNFVDMYLYGISIEPVIGDKSGTWEKRILAAKQYFSLKALGLGFVPAMGSFIAAKTNAVIEGSKGQVYTREQYLQSLKNSYGDRPKFLALSAFFDPMGHRYGNFSVTTQKQYGKEEFGNASERNWINKYVNGRMFMRPFSAGDEYIDEIILGSVAQNYYVDELGNLRRMKTDEDRVKFKDRSIWSLFEFKDNNAKLNLDEEQVKNVIINFRSVAQAIQSKIKGTIPEEDKAYWQSQIVGQVVMHFKSWMPGIIKERFGELKYNSSLMAVDIGRYRAVGLEFSNVEGKATMDWLKEVLTTKLGQFAKHLLFFGKLGKMNDAKTKEMFFDQWLEENPHYKGKITYDEFVDIQQKQVKALMIELRILLAFAGLLMALLGDWDDDGQKDYKQWLVTRKLASVMFKTQQELSFVYNPVEFAKLLKNPIPIISLATDAAKALSNGLDELRDVLFGENSTSDKTPFLYYTSSFVPGGRLLQFIDFFNKDVAYD